MTQWHVEKINLGIDGDAFSVVDDNGVEVASVHREVWQWDKKVQLPAEKNAQTLATAPELLHAAKLVVARWEHGDLADAVRQLAAAVEIADNGERLCSGFMCERRAREGHTTCRYHKE